MKEEIKFDQDLIDFSSSNIGVLTKYQARVKVAKDNLLEGKVELDIEDFPSGQLPARPIRGGGDTEFVPGWWFIREMNYLFGFRWSFEIIEQFIGEKQVWVLGKLTIPVSSKMQEIRYPDGTIVVNKVDGGYITKMQYGGSDIKRDRKNNQVIDIADDLKAAATDSFKKCCTVCGVALSVYGKREESNEKKTSTSQLNSYYKLFEDVGKARDEAIKYCVDEYGVQPEELTEKKLIVLISKARKSVKV